jgi:hypothetical protein
LLDHPKESAVSTVPSPTPAQFRAAHGDVAGWSPVDFEVYEHLVLTQPRGDQLRQVLAEHCVVDGPAPAAA